MTSDPLPLLVVGDQAGAARWREAAADPGLAVEAAPTMGAALDALRNLAGRASHAAIVDGALVMSRGFAEEAARAVADPALAGVPWAVLAGSGHGIDGRHHDNTAYLDIPALPIRGARRGLAAPAPAPALVSLAAPLGGAADLAAAAAAGWEAGLGSFLSPHLRCAYPGARHDRPPGAAPALWPSTALTRRLDAVRAPPTITVVVRTALRRPQMLRRTFASLTAAGAPDEVLLAGRVGAADLEAEAAALRRVHPELAIRALHVPAGDEPPRTAAVTRAVAAAGCDYVWFVDDDDALAPGALRVARNAVHAADRPAVLGAAVEVREQWRDGRLVTADEVRTWDPGQWPRSFTGWNMLPFCSMVLPRDAAAERLAAVPLRHDLGEDFALLLLVLTAPGQAVVTVPETLARVSIRAGGDNVVTAADREDWLRSATGFVSDLAADPQAGAEAPWAVGRLLRDLPGPPPPLAEARWRTWGKRVVPTRLQPAVRRLLHGWRSQSTATRAPAAAPPSSRGPVERTLVLLCRDDAGHVVGCIDALARRSGEAVEILVVDEGSTDGSVDRAADAWGADPRVRTFTTVPGGTAEPGALVRNVRAGEPVVAFRAGRVLSPAELPDEGGADTAWPAGWVEVVEPERRDLGEDELAAAVTGRVVLLPGVAYHVDELGPLAAALDEGGLPAVFAVSDHRWEGVRRALRRYRAPVVRCPAPGRWLDGAAAVVTLNDWAEVYRDVVLAANERGIPTFGKVEGVQDFADDDVGWQRRPYRTVDHVLCQGGNDVAALAGADTHVVGSSRLEALWTGPVAAPEAPQVVINLNFTYGVLEEHRGAWLASAVAGCRQAALPFVVSVHPAETSVPTGVPVSPWPVGHSLATSTALVSRFSTVPFEAIARGVPFVYHNPHGERVPAFGEPQGAYPATADSAGLAAGLAALPPPGEGYRREAAAFFRRQVDIDPHRPPAQRAADVIAKFARRRAS